MEKNNETPKLKVIPYEVYIKGRVMEKKSVENKNGMWHSLKLISGNSNKEGNIVGSLAWLTAEEKAFRKVVENGVYIFKGILRRYQAVDGVWKYHVRLLDVVENERLIAFSRNFE